MAAIGTEIRGGGGAIGRDAGEGMGGGTMRPATLLQAALM